MVWENRSGAQVCVVRIDLAVPSPVYHTLLATRRALSPLTKNTYPNQIPLRSDISIFSPLTLLPYTNRTAQQKATDIAIKGLDESQSPRQYLQIAAS